MWSHVCACMCTFLTCAQAPREKHCHHGLHQEWIGPRGGLVSRHHSSSSSPAQAGSQAEINKPTNAHRQALYGMWLAMRSSWPMTERLYGIGLDGPCEGFVSQFPEELSQSSAKAQPKATCYSERKARVACTVEPAHPVHLELIWPQGSLSCDVRLHTEDATSSLCSSVQLSACESTAVLSPCRGRAARTALQLLCDTAIHSRHKENELLNAWHPSKSSRFK